MKLNEVAKQQDFQTFTKQIRENCSDYIAEMKNMKSPNGHQDALMRGLMDAGNYGTSPIRTDRKPLDTPSFISSLYNFIAEKQLGVANLREKVIFASGMYESAASFGVVNYIFPMNGTTYYYEPGVTDSIFSTKRIQHEIYKTANRPGWKGLYGGYPMEGIIQRLSVAPASIQQKFMQTFYELNPRIIELYKGNVQRLPAYISSGDEVMLSGTPQYYHINVFYLQTYLNAKTSQEAIATYAKILDTGEWIYLDSDEPEDD